MDDVIVALMRGIANNALGEPEAVRPLKDRIAEVVDKFAQDPEAIRPTIPETVLGALQTHNKAVEERYAAQLRERRMLTLLLTEAITTLAGATQETTDRMDSICKDLERSQSRDRDHDVVEAIDTCLQRLRAERDQQKQTASKLMLELRAGLLQIGDTMVDIHAPEPMDPATGLPAMTAALEAFHITLKEKKSEYTVCVMIPSGMRTINARLGYEVGDQILATVAQRMLKFLSGDDLLFRWRGPCIVALMQAPREDMLSLRRKVVQLMTTRLERTFEVGSRLALVPITCSWEFIPLQEPISEVCEQINRFIASRDLENSGATF